MAQVRIKIKQYSVDADGERDCWDSWHEKIEAKGVRDALAKGKERCDALKKEWGDGWEFGYELEIPTRLL